MLYLLLSILSASSLIIIIRLFEKWKINATYAIVFNYIFCVLTGLYFVNDYEIFLQMPAWKGFPFVIGLGIAFVFIFTLTGIVTKSAGVVTASISMKLSFVIPVIIAMILYSDSITILKIVGILCAFAAVFLIAYEKETKVNNNATNNISIIYPFLIFIGAGLCDTIFNYIQKKLMPAGWDHPISVLAFISAAISGLLLHFYKKELYQWKNVAAGLVLGVPNYFSLYFLLKTLDTIKMESSVIFPINNLGIVCVSAFAGFVLFKEKLNQRKVIGFVLAVASIIIIGFLS